jgi:superfamily II DNA or RNA helicase
MTLNISDSSTEGYQFIIVFTERYRLGMTAIPYIATQASSESNITLIEQLTSERIKNAPITLNDIQTQIIKQLDEISDKRLHQKYSREKTVKQFYDTLTNETLEKRIRPDIEKRMTQCLELLALTPETPVYFKNSNYSQLYQSDRLTVPLLASEAVFYFDLQPDFLNYTLKVRENEKDFGLLNRQVTFITHEPCSFFLNQKLYRFTDIDSKKIKPFLEKTFIRVPAQSVPSYMEKFVMGCIRDYHVSAVGFEIKDKSSDATAMLNLEQDLGQQPVLSLQFIYNGKKYLAGTKSSVYVELTRDNDQYAFYKVSRKQEWENSIVNKLKELGLGLTGNCHFRPPHVLRDSAAITLHNLITWINVNRAKIDEAGITIEQTFFAKQYYMGTTDIIKQAQEVNDWFDIRLLVKVGEYLIPFSKFKKHIQTNMTEFELSDGSIFIIPDEWFTRYGDLMHFSRNGDNENLLLDKTHFNLLQEALEMELTSAKALQNAMTMPVEAINQPDGLQASLRPYQLQGYAWMNHLANNKLGGILADDMGLGKTLQAITLLLNHYNQTELPATEPEKPVQQQLSLFDQPAIEGFNKTTAPPSIIVMPTSLVHNWESEIHRFAPSLKTYVYTGQNRLKTKDIGKILRHYHVVITSYGVLRNDIDYIKTVDFLFVILDESQYIKNPTSKIYDAVMELNGHHKLVLTGTPIENSLTDLWAQMNFVNPGVLGSHNFFKNQFVTPISKTQSEEHEKRLQALIQPFILRRTKDSVAKELPPVTEQTLHCDMTPEQKKVYEQEKSGVRNELLRIITEQGMEKSTMIALKALTRLRQLANHPVMVDDQYHGSSGKFEQILENIENIVCEKHKVLIFSSFVKDLELIEKELNARQLAYSKLTGATSNRQEVIKSFKENEECRIFLISLKAGGVGLNLTEADYVFMLNPWWNPAAELQAINRAHRIGQTRNVFVYRFISTNTIEEKIARLQEKKQALADTFINSNNPFKNMTEAEIRELFA